MRYLEELAYIAGPEHYKNTESIGRNYLQDLNNLRLVDITAYDYQKVLFSAKKRNGEPLSKKSYQNIRGVIVNFTKFCVKAGLLDKAVTDIQIPRNAEKVGKEILQPDQAKRVMSEFTDEWYIYLWRWLLCTGMRPGEALGLKWSDIENGMVTIRRAQNYRGRITEGKNKNAHRSFALNPILEEILDDQKARTWRLNSEYIFCNHAGKISLQTVTKNSWARISRSLGSNTSPYSLRHTFISFMATSLPEAVLRQWVGHSVNMDTYGVYGHAVNGDAERASEMTNIVLVGRFKN